MKNKSKFSIHHILPLVGLLVLLILPQFITTNYMIGVFINIFVFASLGNAWNIVGGYGGQFSIAHAAFVALGAYTGVIGLSTFGISPILTLPIGMLIAAVFATILGKATFRYTGPFFVITTIAFAEILRILLLFFSGITRGAAGMNVPFRGVAEPFNLVFRNSRPFYFIMLGFMALTVLLVYLFTKSKTGHYLGAIKGNELAATTLGVDASKVKLRAFQVSAMMTAAIGTIYAFFMMLVEPNSIAGVDLGIRIVCVVIVGGLGKLWGPVLGAFIMIPLIEVTNVWFQVPGASQMMFGLLLMVIIILRPGGVITLFDKNVWKNSKLGKKLLGANREKAGDTA